MPFHFSTVVILVSSEGRIFGDGLAQDWRCSKSEVDGYLEEVGVEDGIEVRPIAHSRITSRSAMERSLVAVVTTVVVLDVIIMVAKE